MRAPRARADRERFAQLALGALEGAHELAAVHAMVVDVDDGEVVGRAARHHPDVGIRMLLEVLDEAVVGPLTVGPGPGGGFPAGHQGKQREAEPDELLRGFDLLRASHRSHRPTGRRHRAPRHRRR